MRSMAIAENSAASGTLIQDKAHKKAWLIWGLAASFFLVDYLARVAPSVMNADLMRDFHVTAFLLGGLSSFFYWPYVCMQIPVGLLVDRFGPKRLLAMACLGCFVACAWFGMATSMSSASFARTLLGFVSSFAFVGALKLASQWFPPRQIGLIAGATQAIGMLGASFGQAPLAFGVEIFGWRLTLYMVSVLFIILFVLIGLFVKDHAGDHAHDVAANPAREHHFWNNFISVIRNPQSWINGMYAGFLFAPTAAIGELWGVSFLTQAYQLTPAQAAIGTTFIFIGWGAGGPLGGWISDYTGRRRGVMIGSALLCLIILSYIIYVPNQSFVATTIALFLYGVCNSGVGVAYALASEINPRPMAGTSMAFANMCSIVVGACFQPLIGKILDLQWTGVMEDGVPIYSAGQFRTAFLVLPICMVAALLLCVFVKETYCRPFDGTEKK